MHDASLNLEKLDTEIYVERFSSRDELLVE